MFISAVILSYNSAHCIGRCLEELTKALSSFEEKSEIFVVDNGSIDGSVELINQFKNKYPDIIKTIFFSKNTGTTFSRNSAIKKAIGKYILVLDSDAYIKADAISKLSNFLTTNPTTGMAVPRLFYASGNFQLSCDVFPTLIHKLKRFLFLKKIEAKQHYLQEVTQPVAVDYAISACWLISRAAVEKTGLFDEKIFYSPEDVDYCLRIWESGFNIMYLPNAEIIHDAQELSRGFRLSMFHFSHLKGLMYLMKKHRYFFGVSNLYKRINRFNKV